MYVPKFNEEHQRNVMHGLMRANPPGTWVTLTDDGLMSNAIPFLLDDTRGEFGTLCCHVARAKWKLGQNRPKADQLGIVAGLTARSSTSAQAVADALTRHMAKPCRR